MLCICFAWKTVFSSPFVSRLLSFVSFCLFVFSFCFASPTISDQLEPSNQKCKGTSAKDWTVIWAPSSVLPFRSWIARSAVARQSKSTFPVQLELPLSSGAQDLLKPHRFIGWTQITLLGNLGINSKRSIQLLTKNNNCNFSKNAWNHLAPSCWIHVDRRIANFTYTLAELPQGLRQRVAAEPWACSLKARTFRAIWLRANCIEWFEWHLLTKEPETKIFDCKSLGGRTAGRLGFGHTCPGKCSGSVPM